jgi:Family of unknown function (DUF6498)
MVTAESTRSLLLSNAVAAGMALVLHWPLETLLWPYWFQSVIIGWYSRKRVLALKNFSTDGLTMNGQPVPVEPQSLRRVARFFTMHYGFFHAGYLAFLLNKAAPLGLWDWLGVSGVAVSFAISHRKSFQQNLEADAGGRPNLGALMFLPYLRILPMHFTIILGHAIGGSGPATVLLFSALKTGADVLMHHANHAVLQRARAKAAPAATSVADTAQSGMSRDR